jgi:hypothetical protein
MSTLALSTTSLHLRESDGELVALIFCGERLILACSRIWDEPKVSRRVECWRACTRSPHKCNEQKGTSGSPLMMTVLSGDRAG